MFLSIKEQRSIFESHLFFCKCFQFGVVLEFCRWVKSSGYIHVLVCIFVEIYMVHVPISPQYSTGKPKFPARNLVEYFFCTSGYSF